jgi:fluoroacetyl-CoA thioesterase
MHVQGSKYKWRTCRLKWWTDKDMKQDLETGLALTRNYLIRSEHAAGNVGSGEVEVLSTPAMIAFMERTSRKCVQPRLSEGAITVGTAINVKHLSPVLIGEELEVKAQLLEIDGRRLRFKVETKWQNQVIGKGWHERYIVNEERFLKKLRE